MSVQGNFGDDIKVAHPYHLLWGADLQLRYHVVKKGFLHLVRVIDILNAPHLAMPATLYINISAQMVVLFYSVDGKREVAMYASKCATLFSRRRGEMQDGV